MLHFFFVSCTISLAMVNTPVLKNEHPLQK